jgi:hypothetical protein
MAAAHSCQLCTIKQCHYCSGSSARQWQFSKAFFAADSGCEWLSEYMLKAAASWWQQQALLREPLPIHLVMVVQGTGAGVCFDY